MKRTIFMALGILAGTAVGITSAMAKEPHGELVDFKLGLSSAEYESGYEYSAKFKNNELLVHMYYYTSSGIVEKRRAVNGDTQFLKGLDQVIKDHRLYNWNGFHKENPHVLDGEGFYFRAKYKTGEEINGISASGSNVFPDDYDRSSMVVGQYFKENVDKLPTVKEEYTFPEVKQEVVDALQYMAKQGIIRNTVGGEVFAFSAKGDVNLALITIDIAMDPGHAFQLLVRNHKILGLKVVAADNQNIEPKCAGVDHQGELVPISIDKFDDALRKNEF